MNPILTIPGLPEFLIALNAVNVVERPRVLIALGLMIGLHSDQGFRLTGEHYASHPLEVARLLIEEFGVTNSDLVIIALLHDTLEDQLDKLVAMAKCQSGDARAVAVRVLADIFNQFVADGVLALSNPVSDKSLAPDMKRDKYFHHVRVLFELTPEFALVKCADLRCNAGNLHLLTDSERKTKMQRKYYPVLQYIIAQLSQIDDSAHVLYPATLKFLPKMASVIASWKFDPETEELRHG